MLYEPTDHLDAARLPDVVQGLQSQDVLLDDEPKKRDGSNRVTRSVKGDKRREHMADVARAALYLACGGKQLIGHTADWGLNNTKKIRQIRQQICEDAEKVDRKHALHRCTCSRVLGFIFL